jgi:glycosyltransferase involved in cell wall biosynthesis
LLLPADVSLNGFFGFGQDNLKKTQLPFSRKALHAAWYLGWKAFTKKRISAVDVMHFPDPINFALGSAGTVMTIHDIAWKKIPSAYPLKSKIIYDMMLRRILRSPSHLIAISYATRSDLVRQLGVNGDRISVIHEACDPGFRPVEDFAGAKERCGISGNYILTIGVNPRKNIGKLIEAYSRLDKQILKEYSLVLAGSNSYGSGKLQRIIANLGIEERVVFTGHVNDDDLPGLISGAELFVYPSLYEGFGLPILEAMACGTPVVTSNLSSMPEIAGDAAVLVSPHDVEQIADAVEQVLSSTDLQASLIEKGFLRASSFSFERMARETLAVYTKIHAAA